MAGDEANVIERRAATRGEATRGLDPVGRKLRMRGRPAAPPRARRPLGERLRDGAVAALLLGITAGSAWTALTPDRFDSEAPIRLAEGAGAVPPAPTELAAALPPASPDTGTPPIDAPALDPRPLSGLGEVRGAVESGSKRRTGGPKVIEIEPGGRVRDAGPIVIRDPSDMRQPPRVAHLPDKTLLAESEYGPLPVSSGERRPLDVYAGRWSGRRGKRIAIVVGGIGISQSGSAQAVEALPGKVTLAFSPEGNSLRRWMQAARRDGHELLLQVPMQGFGREGPDPRGHRLLIDASPAENAARLRRSLGRLTNYVGVMNYRGGAFQADADALAPVLAELRDRGLMYLDDGSSGQSRARRVAAEARAPFAGADLVLDARRQPAAIAGQLERLEELARGTGRAIGIASAFPESVAAIATWIESAESRGFEIVPVSALASGGAGR